MFDSKQNVAIESVFGKWAQAGSFNITSEGVYPPSVFSAIAIFDKNGKYYLKYMCDNTSTFKESSGNWYYLSRPRYFFGFLHFGHQNWIKLDFDHDTQPQFYLKTDEDGNIHMYRAFNSSCISNNKFLKQPN